MSELIERLPRAGGFIASEAPGTRSRSTVIVGISALLMAGTVLGISGVRAAVGAPGLPAPAAATITAVPTAAGATKLGKHRFECIVGGSAAASKWRHTDPDGDFVGVAVGNTAYSGGGLGLTITDAGADPTAGEAFEVTVTEAEGGGSYKPFDPDATDGTQHAAAILYDEVDASVAAQNAVVVDCDAEVIDAYLTWPEGISDGELMAAISQLRMNGIKILAAV